MLAVFILREAMRALRRNKMRSGLTVLGVMIGIGAVICVVALGTAGADRIQEQLALLGDNLVWVEAGGRNVAGVRTGTGQTKTLIPDDMKAIVNEVPLIKTCSAQADSRVQLVFGNQNWPTQYRGVSPEYFDIKSWKFTQGGPFTADDTDRSANVCVIGQTVKTSLFGATTDPLNQIIRVKGLPMRVIGVLFSKGQSPTGQDQDDTMMIPYTTGMKKISGVTWLDDILCSAVSRDAIMPATAQITVLLTERHHIRPEQDADFNMRSPEDVINAQSESTRTFNLLLVSIASVSLLVGGIGIMNVMLVSVTERTREIGIRLSVGATEQSIQFQFLGEAVMLSLIGGAAGIVIGIGGTQLLGQMLKWPMRISPQAIVVAALFASAVGVFFGYYPARKASRMDPIEALRFE
jgi:putative ABC transport system permease protein